MKLFSTTLGHGPDIVLLHGWGLHSGVWEGVARALSAQYRVTLIDLPGHGRSPAAPPGATLDDWADAVLGAAPPRAVWLGWSLGGLLALHIAAAQPRRVAALALTAATPRFTQAPDWPHAVAAPVLDDFARALTRDYAATVRRFLALQTRGAAHGHDTLRRLNALLQQHEPQSAGLQNGLALLRDTDLRARVANVACPVLLIAGERDTLVPVAANRALVLMFGFGRLCVIQGAGHAPLLSHAPEFIQALRDFLHDAANPQ